jgi:hypothetical protein
MRFLTENNEDEELSTLGDAKGDYISLRNHRLVRIDRSGSLEGLACDSVHGIGRDIQEDPFLPSSEVNNPCIPHNILSINNTLGDLKTKRGPYTFIIDSEATIPVVSNISLFQTYKSCNKTVN